MSISKFKAETLRTLAHGSVAAGYAAVGGAFTHPISKLHIVNDLDVGVYFSDDGTNNKIYIANGMDLLLDITIENDNPDYLAKGTVFYVKQGPEGAASSGLVTIAAFYGENK